LDVPGEQIVEARKKLNLTQEDLASAANVGIASIRRWETGQIQTKPMDDVLRNALSGKKTCADPYTGNRTLSLPRIRLVLGRFSSLLGRNLLRSDGDKLIYAAKYLWYADMIAFREIGRNLTGATYAALPHGPQLNNYRELIPLIRRLTRIKLILSLNMRKGSLSISQRAFLAIKRSIQPPTRKGLI